MLNCLPTKKKKQFLYYFIIYFYIILYDFINCPAFVDIKHNLALRSSNRANINRERLMFASYVCFSFLCRNKFFSGCFR